MLIMPLAPIVERMDADGSARLLRRVVELIEEARRCDSDEIPPEVLLDGLASVVPGLKCDFSELDLPTRRYLNYKVDSGSEVFEDPDGLEKYFRLRHQHPTCAYRERTGSMDVMQFSDFLTLRQLHDLEIYQECFKPEGIEHLMSVPLPTAPGRTRVLMFSRGAGMSFTETERWMLTLLQPHIYEIYRAAARRRGMRVTLTNRQLDVLRCVALDMSKDQVARRLIISPQTVDKHLEAIYRRLNVQSRTAAVARVFPPVDAEPQP
jgi:DNA-binding CsgD family transcriptional regulator